MKTLSGILRKYEFDGNAHFLGKCTQSTTAQCSAIEHEIKQFISASIRELLEQVVLKEDRDRLIYKTILYRIKKILT